MLSAALVAQTTSSPAPMPNHVRFLTAKLGLTTQQQSQAGAVFSNATAAEAPLRASLKTARQGLSDAVKSNNTVNIEQLSETIGQLTGQLTAARAKAQAAFYQILTADQRAELDAMQNQRSGRYRGAGHFGARGNVP